MNTATKKKTRKKSNAQSNAQSSTPKKGDLLSAIEYYRVEKVQLDPKASRLSGAFGGDPVPVVTATNIKTGTVVELRGKPLLDAMQSADSFSSTEKLSRTDVVAKMLASHGRVFTVKYETQEGEPRTLRGYFMKHETLFGRTLAFDLDINEPRLVCHRKLQELVLDGVRYQVK